MGISQDFLSAAQQARRYAQERLYGAPKTTPAVTPAELTLSLAELAFAEKRQLLQQRQEEQEYAQQMELLAHKQRIQQNTIQQARQLRRYSPPPAGMLQQQVKMPTQSYYEHLTMEKLELIMSQIKGASGTSGAMGPKGYRAGELEEEERQGKQRQQEQQEAERQSLPEWMR